MTFRAKLLRGAPVWRHWRGESRTAGTLCGVAFRWTAGDDYATDDLDADQVERLRGHPDVQMETFGALPPSPLATTVRATPLGLTRDGGSVPPADRPAK